MNQSPFVCFLTMCPPSLSHPMSPVASSIKVQRGMRNQTLSNCVEKQKPIGRETKSWVTVEVSSKESGTDCIRSFSSRRRRRRIATWSGLWFVLQCTNRLITAAAPRVAHRADIVFAPSPCHLSERVTSGRCSASHVIRKSHQGKTAPY